MRHLFFCATCVALLAIVAAWLLANRPIIAQVSDPAAAANCETRVRSSLFDCECLEFAVDGRKAFVLIPSQPRSVTDAAWVWYAPTLLAERESEWVSPGARHAWIFRELLAGGLHVAGVDVGESYGSPAGRTTFDTFYEIMVSRLKFSPKPALLAVSRGGLMAYNWAADHPDRVRRIAAIYPVCNLRAYPRIDKLVEPYQLSREQLLAQIDQHDPLARLAGLARAGIPLLHLHGDQDAVVPLESHSAELGRRYQQLGGSMQLIIVSGKGHEVVPEFWQEPRLVAFLASDGQTANAQK